MDYTPVILGSGKSPDNRPAFPGRAEETAPNHMVSTQLLYPKIFNAQKENIQTVFPRVVITDIPSRHSNINSKI